MMRAIFTAGSGTMSTLRTGSFLATLLVVLFTAVISVNVLWRSAGGEGWRETIRSDAKGYYGYLVAVFIRGDLGHEPYAWEYTQRTPTGTLNKYFCGTSVMMAPWFIVGHDLALGDPKVRHDGFSSYEMKAISVGGWLYLLLGLLCMRALLMGMGVRDGIILWVILALGLGTTLLQYAAVQPGWSHIHSFCTISAFLLLAHKLGRGGDPRWAIAAAALLGLIVIIRPVNGLVLLAVPIVTGNNTIPLIQRLLARPIVVVLAATSAAAIIFLQPLLWYMQTGNWFEWGYRNEGFHWWRPEVLEVLFGFRRGLFLWTPVLLLPALCAFLLWRRDRTRSVFSLLYWASNTYIISAWWIWYYGSGFGSRVYIDHYPVLFIPFALVANRWNTRWWTITRMFIILCIAFHLAQFAQYHLQVLHVESMDREKYMWSLLRFDEAHRDKLGGNNELPPYHPHGLEDVLVAATDLERPSEFWHGGNIQRHPKAFSGAHVCVYDARTEFGSTFIAPPGSIPLGRELHVEAVVQRYEEHAGDSFDAIGIVSVQRPDSSFAFYKSFRMNPLPGDKDDHWRRLHFEIPVVALHEGERLSFYLWNQGRRSRFLLDDLFIRVRAVKAH